VSRDIHPATAIAARGAVVCPVLLLELDYPEGVVRVSSMDETREFAGHVYTAVGALGKVSSVQEGAEARSYGVTASLSGVPGNFAAYLQTQDVQGRRATVRIALLDSANELIGQPIVAYEGRMDTQDVTSGSTTEVAVAIESLLIDWERARVRRYTDADQQAAFPGDRGLEFVPSLQNLTLKWGR
jgi:hypothetical protein